VALVNFKHSPLPAPPQEYDAQYVRQLIRVIELYFNQLDSQTPNQAQSYTAVSFIGGTITLGNYTNAEKLALITPPASTPATGMMVFDTTLNKISVYYSGGWRVINTVPSTTLTTTGVSATGSVGTVTVSTP
jgi:hypothetical protein